MPFVVYGRTKIKCSIGNNLIVLFSISSTTIILTIHICRDISLFGCCFCFLIEKEVIISFYFSGRTV